MNLRDKMGRGKVEIKRIENTSNRQVTYSKRRNGIIKKAKEITILCDAKVSLVIFATSGKMHEYCSPSTNLVDIMDQYHKQSGRRLWDAKQENLNSEIDRVKKENDSMQIELRQLKGEDITSLQLKELIHMEKALSDGLIGIRDQQMEIHRNMQRDARILEEENKDLYLELQQLEINELGLGTNVWETDTAIQQRIRDYNSHIPFNLIQPNLQDMI